MQYYQGKREAEMLIENRPAQVGNWLSDARRVRRHWMTRLFHREKRQYLDGFITALEAHVNACK